jgi:hypothetical protein
MTDAIDFLEHLGRTARLRHVGPEELEQLLAGTGIDPAVQGALLSQDARQLGELLGAQPNVCCLIEKPDQEEDDEEQEDEDDEEKATRLS